MSKTTLAIIAAGSAAAGASLTALILGSSKPQSQSHSSPPSSTPPPPSTSTTPTPTTSLPPRTDNTSPPSPPQPGPVPVLPSRIQSPVNPSGVLQYGFVGPVSDSLTTSSHLSSYNRALRNPHWVAEHFTPTSLAVNNGSRRNSVFYEDDTIPPMFRAKLGDYFRSGYDRGHQVPAADAKWSQEAMDSTFVLSNMAPQVGDGFNRDYWAHLEEFCRNLTRRYPSVRVVTGPLYLPKQQPDGKWRTTYEVVGNPPNVAVPTHFYKIVYGEETARENVVSAKVALAAFVLPNAHIPNTKSLQDFEVPLEAVEKASGLTFAERLPVQRRKRLCQEVRCEILVREFNKAQGQVVRG